MSVKNQEIEKAGLLRKTLEVRKNISTTTDNHNLEFVSEINGVAYVNDSMAFSVNTTKRSIESIEAPVTLITGGFDINNDYSSLSGTIKEKVKAVIYLGKEPGKIFGYCKSKESILFVSAISLSEAVEIASTYTVPGNVVLFSPACASGKEFADYKIRGAEFKRLVNLLLYKKA